MNLLELGRQVFKPPAREKYHQFTLSDKQATAVVTAATFPLANETVTQPVDVATSLLTQVNDRDGRLQLEKTLAGKLLATTTTKRIDWQDPRIPNRVAGMNVGMHYLLNSTLSLAKWIDIPMSERDFNPNHVLMQALIRNNWSMYEEGMVPSNIVQMSTEWVKQVGAAKFYDKWQVPVSRFIRGAFSESLAMLALSEEVMLHRPDDIFLTRTEVADTKLKIDAAVTRFNAHGVVQGADLYAFKSGNMFGRMRKLPAVDANKMLNVVHNSTKKVRNNLALPEDVRDRLVADLFALHKVVNRQDQPMQAAALQALIGDAPIDAAYLLTVPDHSHETFWLQHFRTLEGMVRSGNYNMRGK